MKRHGISQPQNQLYTHRTWQDDDFRAILNDIFSPHLKGSSIDVDTYLDDAQYYHFAPMELLNFPMSNKGRYAFMSQGRLNEGIYQYLNPNEFGAPSIPYCDPLPVEVLSDNALIRQIADRLAQVVGPLADNLMHDST
ncbi:MAG: hypothetical protein ACI82O_003492 [Patiriisocius sp.]|jgi:hypothetical protein